MIFGDWFLWFLSDGESAKLKKISKTKNSLFILIMYRRKTYIPVILQVAWALLALS